MLLSPLPLREESEKGTFYPRTYSSFAWNSWDTLLRNVPRVPGLPLKLPMEMWAYLIYFFVNDLILFAKVNMKVCEAIPDVLQVLCSKLGQKVSAKKSRIYFSPNVDSNLKERI